MVSSGPLLTLDPAQLAEMVNHARAGFPNEACGLLASRKGRVTKVFLLRNADESPVTYRIDAQEQLHAMLEIDDEGWDVAAIFHSHTRTRAYPSPTDVRLAIYPDVLQIIISLADPDHPEVRAYRISDGAISEEALEVTQEADDATQSPPSDSAHA